MKKVIVALASLAVVLGGCGDSESDTIVLLTHESFVLSEGTFDAFTEETGITVEGVSSGDAGSVVAGAIATAGDPIGDVLFGVDNLLMQRALDADVFQAHVAEGLDDVPDRFKLDPENRLTPIDTGYVCVNYRDADLGANDVPLTLEDLRRPEFASTFITQNPESSTPGLAFLFATIAAYGEDGWQDYWRDLKANGVTITSGWSEAWAEYVGGDPGGDKAIVNSYASSPVFEGLFGGDNPTLSTIMLDSCFAQIEFAGVLAGTDSPTNAGKLVDYLLSPAVQSDIPLNMFVEPVNSQASIPTDFSRWTTPVTDPLTLSPSDIAANQARWTQEWLDIFR
ncbi:MAG: thiamine ABC transporter substrate-binding protein [Acidimicrobiales bacterium]|nr:thiamine ABC transporter substrate-binding protein [Acidimicrobiales bacterium]